MPICVGDGCLNIIDLSDTTDDPAVIGGNGAYVSWVPARQGLFSRVRAIKYVTFLIPGAGMGTVCRSCLQRRFRGIWQTLIGPGTPYS